MFQSMFHLPLPFLIVFLRIFGKRELAQLNPFDLVVLLSLSNTVQNAMIGDDNSVTGGVIGAFSLLAINWFIVRLLFKTPKLTAALEGKETVLIRHGVVDDKALAEETLTREELLSVLHKQNVDDFSEVEKCVLEPNGNFYVEIRKPSAGEVHLDALSGQIAALTAEMKQLRAELAAKG